MKTICTYAVASHLGGAERSLLELLESLQRRPELGYAPWVIVPQEGPLTAYLAKAGIRYDVLPFPGEFFEMSRGAPILALKQFVLSSPAMALYLKKLRDLVRANRPAAIHTHAIKCHAVGAVVGSMTGTPVIWHLRDILGHGPTWAGLHAFRKLGKVYLVANSRATADAFGQGEGICVIHNGLSPEKFFPKRNRIFNVQMGVSPETPIVGIVGVLARWKGQIEFLQMACLLAEKGIDCRFAIIGSEIYDTVSDRGYGAALHAEAKGLGISDRVLFAGYRDDPAEVMNGLDVLVHASLKPEPFGRVIVEAMACGTPVVASSDGGVLEIVKSGKTGLLVKPGDSEAMARTVARILKDQELAQRFSEEGLKVFRERFTCDHYVREIVALYDSVSSRKRAR